MQNSSEQSVAYYSSFTRAWELLAGVLAAFAAGRRPWPGWVSRLAVVTGLIAIVAAGFLIDGVADHPGPWALVPVLATVLVIVGGAGSGTVPFAGWAFALYLWHWPLLIFWMAHTNDDTVGVGGVHGHPGRGRRGGIADVALGGHPGGGRPGSRC